MTTTINPRKSSGLKVAGCGITEDMLLRVARVLLADVYWTDEREEEYAATFGQERDIMKRPETPQVPDKTHAVMLLAHVCGRIEQAWGESFHSIAFRICKPDKILSELREELVYLTVVACIRHGFTTGFHRHSSRLKVGPNDVEGFPTELGEAPIQIENPMRWQLGE